MATFYFYSACATWWNAPAIPLISWLFVLYTDGSVVEFLSWCVLVHLLLHGQRLLLSIGIIN